MKILIVSPYALYNPHFDTELEIAENHLQKNDSVTIVGCNSHLQACDANANHNLHNCLVCISRRTEGIKLLSKEIDVKPIYYLSQDNITEVNNFIEQIPDNLESLKIFKIDNFDIGYSVLSSLNYIYKIAEFDFSEYKSLIHNLCVSALMVYRSIQNYLFLEHYDRVYTFNGRMSILRAVLRACQSKNVNCFLHERGSTLNHYSLCENTLPHDIKYRHSKIVNQWNFSTLDIQEKEKIGAEFFVERSKGIMDSWTSFTDYQKENLLPDNWDDQKNNIVIYTSSEHEYASIGDIWKINIYESQFDGLQKIIESVKHKSNLHLYLRVHPLMKNFEYADRELREKFNILSSPNLTVIPAESEISTYALLKKASKIITFGSTVGIEAVYWGKPSILLGSSLYQDMGVTYNPNSHEELLILLEEDLQPKDKIASLMYGYYSKTFGIPFKHYQASGIFTGTFKGVNIVAKPFDLIGNIGITAENSNPTSRETTLNAQTQKNKENINQTLSVCMMVQNNEKTLEIALSSLDHVYDELIIVDGESTDKTIEIAKKYGAKIIHSPWSGNHSQQRNVYLKEINTDWVFVLDSDEFIDQKTLEFLQNLKVNCNQIDCDNFWIPRKWISHYNKNFYVSSSPHYPDWQRRILKYNQDISYSGQIHENISGLRDQGQALLDISVYHLDLLINSESQRAEKVKRYTEADSKSGMPHYYIPDLNNISLQKWNHQDLLPQTRELLDKIPVKCKICDSDSHYFAISKILQKYDVNYYQCSNCGFVQTEEPYWLNEAYSEAIAPSDVGLLYRNNMMANITAKLLFNYFDHEAKFLDYGGGYGVFVRLMRDQGFDFYWQDKYCQNLFATGFELKEKDKSELLLVTAFELFEHLTYPTQELEKMLKLAPNILFSTSLLPKDNPKPDQWWYYTPHEGQHIAIYTRKSLEILAEKYNLKLYTDGSSLHLLSTNKNLPENLFDLIKTNQVETSNKKSFLSSDFNQVVNNILAKDNQLNSNQLVNIPEVKSPIIIIDGVFFQLYKTGIARVWKSLLQQWVNTEFANHILVLDRANSAPHLSGIRYRQIPAYDYNNTEADRQMLQQICDEEGAELFISSYYTTPINTPSVFMAYDMIPEILGGDLNQPMWREKHQAINHASGFIAISENTAKDINKFFPHIPTEAITVAHCGVAQLFSPASEIEIQQFKHKYGINKPYFLLGGLGGYKNSILFFQAFSQLANKTGFDVVATGTNPQLPSEWRQFTTGCTFHGLQLTDEELRLAYSGAVALVYPSKYEGFGMPVIEAMACGCPVITTPNGSLPEAGGEAVIYVKDDDIEGMANALCDVQKPTLRRNLTQAGLQQAQKFSWATMAEIVKEALFNAISPQIKLTETNYLIFPDWQSDEELSEELYYLIANLATNPPLPLGEGLGVRATGDGIITLIIDTTGITEEDANLILSAIAMNLMLEEELDLENSLDFALISNLNQQQWSGLLTQITAKINLKNENKTIINELEIDDLITIDGSGNNYVIFPDWSANQEQLAEEIGQVLANLVQEENATLLVNLGNADQEEVGLFFSEIAMNLMLVEGIELPETVQISFVNFNDNQWASLGRLIKEKISMNSENIPDNLFTES